MYKFAFKKNESQCPTLHIISMFSNHESPCPSLLLPPRLFTLLNGVDVSHQLLPVPHNPLLCLLPWHSLLSQVHVYTVHPPPPWSSFPFPPLHIHSHPSSHVRTTLTTFHANFWGSGQGLVAMLLDSRFDPHTGHGSLLKLGQCHLPSIYLCLLICKWVPTLLERYLQWTSVLSRRVSTTAL